MELYRGRSKQRRYSVNLPLLLPHLEKKKREKASKGEDEEEKKGEEGEKKKRNQKKKKRIRERLEERNKGRNQLPKGMKWSVIL